MQAVVPGGVIAVGTGTILLLAAAEIGAQRLGLTTATQLGLTARFGLAIGGDWSVVHAPYFGGFPPGVKIGKKSP